MINQRCKLPLKIATAITVTIISALWLDWGNPYWAAFAVIVMSITESNGHSLKKGRLRIIGTFGGVLMAFTLISLFAQQPLYLLLSYTVLVATCAYQQTNLRNGYAWTMCLVVSSLVISMASLDNFGSADTFNIAVLRTQETILGVFCFTLVFNLMWPVSSRELLFSTLHGYFESQDQQLNAAMDEIHQHCCFNTQFLLGVSLQRLTRLDDLIEASSVDSYQVSSNHVYWLKLHQQLSEWVLLRGYLQEATSLLNRKFTREQCDELSLFLQNMQQRSASSVRLLQTDFIEADYVNPRSVTLKLNLTLKHGSRSEMDFRLQNNIRLMSVVKQGADPHFDGLHMLERVLNKMDVLQHDILLILYQAVKGTLPAPDALMLVSDNASPRYNASSIPAPWFIFHSERAIHGLKVGLILWLCVALWIYVPMTGGPMVVMFGTVFGGMVMTLPFANTRSILRYMVGWSCVFLVEYIFIMPLLTGVFQLGAFYFINIFALWYWFNQPQQIYHRLLGSLFLVIMTDGPMSLIPSFNALNSLLTLLIISVGMLVISFVHHGVYSCSPERVFLRQLMQFRQSLKKEIHDLLANTERRPLIGFPNPLRLVATADLASQRIDWQHFPDANAEQMTTLINNAYRMCLHYGAFQKSYSKWRQQGYHCEIDALIRAELEDLSWVLDERMYNTALAKQGVTISQLRGQLQNYLLGQDEHAACPFALNHQQAETCYRLLTSLSLLIDALNAVKRSSQQSQVQTLQLSPFSL